MTRLVDLLVYPDSVDLLVHPESDERFEDEALGAKGAHYQIGKPNQSTADEFSLRYESMRSFSNHLMFLERFSITLSIDSLMVWWPRLVRHEYEWLRQRGKI